MRDFKILTDSCCDLPDDIIKEFDIGMISYYVSLDGKNYLLDRIDISIEDFCEQIETNKNLFPKTSFPPLNEFINFFRQYLKDGLDVLFISMTSKFSGAFQAVINASETLKEEYPDSEIIITDSEQVSMGEGLLVIQAAKMKKAGCSITQISDFINKTKSESKLFATVNSLSYLQKGGRIGKVSAIAGNILNIKPIISVKNGELYPHSKVRGRKKAVEEIVNLIIKETQSEKDNYDYAVFHLCAHQEADEIINLLKNKFYVDINLSPIKIGSIIGSHIGPTVLVVAAVKKYLHN